MLNAVLGDGMSSRLFLEVREERGLAYDVGSSIVELRDAGVLSVYAGVDPGRIRPTIAAVLEELARLRDEDVPTPRWRRSRPTSPAASSSASTRPATWPRGSAPRRRSTIG